MTKNLTKSVAEKHVGQYIDRYRRILGLYPYQIMRWPDGEVCLKDKIQEELKSGFERAWIPEPWPLEGAPKTDLETAVRLAQMPVSSLKDAIDQIIEGMVKAGFKAEEAADAISLVISAGVKPEPLSHLTNNWRKMHGLPMHRKPASFWRRRRCLDGRKGMEA